MYTLEQWQVVIKLNIWKIDHVTEALLVYFALFDTKIQTFCYVNKIAFTILQCLDNGYSFVLLQGEFSC